MNPHYVNRLLKVRWRRRRSIKSPVTCCVVGRSGRQLQSAGFLQGHLVSDISKSTSQLEYHTPSPSKAVKPLDNTAPSVLKWSSKTKRAWTGRGGISRRLLFFRCSESSNSLMMSPGKMQQLLGHQCVERYCQNLTTRS